MILENAFVTLAPDQEENLQLYFKEKSVLIHKSLKTFKEH